MLMKAYEFIQEHGHGRIPTSYPSNPNLASWAKRQRYHYNIYKKYCVNITSDNNRTATIVSNMATATTTAVTTSSSSTVVVLDYDISAAAIKKQNPKASVVKCLMTIDRLKALEAIGFCLNLKNEKWELNYERLRNYATNTKQQTQTNDKQGSKSSTCYPSKHIHYELWKWVDIQRYQMTKWKRGDSSSYMTPERIFKLNAIDFVWEDK